MPKPQIGYAAMLEQFGPTEVIEYCALAEAAGATGDEAAREAIKVGRVFLAKRPHAGAPRFKGDRG